MSKQEFEFLLERYLDNTATPVERAKLLHDYAHEMMDYFRKVEQREPSKVSSIDRQEVLNRIIKEHPELNVVPARKGVNLWLKYAVAAMVIFAVGITVYNVNKVFAPLEEAKRKLVTFQGPRYVKLPDNSTVILADGSKLSYDDTYGVKNRELTLAGEGYFDVQKDSERKFIVHTGKINTVVLGTAFNVKAYPDSSKVVVTVTRGKVQVAGDGRELGIILPNEQIQVNKNTLAFVSETEVNAEKEFAWKRDFLIVDNLSMEEAIDLISQKYNIKIILKNEGLKNCRFTATFLHKEKLITILTVITRLIDARFTMTDKEVVISGKGCK